MLLALACSTAFFSAAFLFAWLGSLAALRQSLDAQSAWQPPAVFVYAAAIAAVAAVLLHQLWLSYCLSLSELCCSLLTLAASGAFFGAAAAAVALTGSEQPWKPAACRTVFHPHHYQVAFFLALCIRHVHATGGSAVLALKWAVLGVLTEGVAAYGADSILSAGLAC
jgi:hypothetical protein